MAEPEHTEVFKTYTGARRFRKYIGRLLTGEKIWGGPYPLAVFLSGAAALGLVVWTYELWKSEYILSDAVKGGTLVVIVMFVAWKLPATNRPLWAMGISFSHAVFASSTGTIGGAPIKTLRKPHRPYRNSSTKPAREVVVEPVLVEAAPTVTTKPAAAAPEQPTRTRRPVSALEVFLEQAGAR